MKELVVGPFKSVVRIMAQVSKELIQVRRRPGAFFSLVLGPFLIMAVFGLGYTGVRRPLETVIVVPPTCSCHVTLPITGKSSARASTCARWRQTRGRRERRSPGANLTWS